MRWPGWIEDADSRPWLIVGAASLVALTVGLFVLGDALDERPEPVRLLSQAQALERDDRAGAINTYLRIIRDYPASAQAETARNRLASLGVPVGPDRPTPRRWAPRRTDSLIGQP